MNRSAISARSFRETGPDPALQGFSQAEAEDTGISSAQRGSLQDRLTHTLEVSQNARTIAKALRLNEDLVEAIALGHDLGHTPFGHAGERALNTVYHFSHNKQSLRVVDCIEKEGRGLNLTWEVRDGILNHKTAGHPHTLEGQVMRISDKLAYIYHDMDDAIRGGILTEDDIPADIRNVLGNSCKERLNRLIHDVIINSMTARRSACHLQ